MIAIEWLDNLRTTMDGDFFENEGVLIIVKKGTTKIAVVNGEMIKSLRIVAEKKKEEK